VTLCAVYTMHKETRSVGFLVQPQNQGRFISGLASKPLGRFISGLASKPVTIVFSDLASKPVAMVSPDLTSKPVVIFLVEPQNQGGGGFPVWASKSAVTV
jgi:hypothetical protein